MDIFPSVKLIRQPDNDQASELLAGKGEGKKLLVVYDGEFDFLQRILAAAGYTDPERDCHLLQRTEGNEALALAELLRQLEVDRVLLFGQEPEALGLHFSSKPYEPTRVADRTYMFCASVASISAAKRAGDSVPSRQLWAGLQQAYLKEAAGPT